MPNCPCPALRSLIWHDIVIRIEIDNGPPFVPDVRIISPSSRSFRLMTRPSAPVRRGHVDPRPVRFLYETRPCLTPSVTHGRLRRSSSRFYSFLEFGFFSLAESANPPILIRDLINSLFALPNPDHIAPNLGGLKAPIIACRRLIPAGADTVPVAMEAAVGMPVFGTTLPFPLLTFPSSLSDLSDPLP